jgi:chromosome segregation ATPase
VKELEGKLAMNETQNTTSDGDLHALRDQLRDTSERLHKAELDNNALRERMSLRQQELDEGRRLLAEARRETEADELRSRLNAAGGRVEEMEREIERLGGELLHTNTRLHTTTRFSAALRDFDEDDLEIEEEDDLFEHPVIIRNATGQSTQSQRVR